jgi:hypothetical protein
MMLLLMVGCAGGTATRTVPDDPPSTPVTKPDPPSAPVTEHATAASPILTERQGIYSPMYGNSHRLAL